MRAVGESKGKSRGPGAASDELRIAVTLPRPDGRPGPTKGGFRLSAATVDGYRPDPVALDAAVTELARRGFRVSAKGALSVSVRGTRAQFESAFGTRLDEMHLDQSEPYAFHSLYYPPDKALWKPDPALQGLIDDAYIQWPHIFMGRRFASPPSALPPSVQRLSLRVPGDVAMLVNAARAHREGITGKGVRVAMIDSGFAHQHPHFVEHGYRTSVALAAGATDRDVDGNGHGTGESANVFAVAPDVTFVGVKLDNEQNPQLGASVLEGFHEALRHSPQVISVSLGYDLCAQGPGRRHLTSLPNGLVALEAEIQAAVRSGIVVVFSAGNGHVSFPGMMPEVISAGGAFVEEDGSVRASDYASAFASRIYPGRDVPDFCGLVGLAADHADYIMLPIPPGCEIDSDNAQHDGTAADDGWGVFSGTSAAAPQVAGVVALLLQRNPGLTPSDVKQVLRRTALDVTDGMANAASNEGVALAATTGWDGATGAGLVDAFAALSQV